jgi:hypothetical protein
VLHLLFLMAADLIADSILSCIDFCEITCIRMVGASFRVRIGQLQLPTICIKKKRISNQGLCMLASSSMAEKLSRLELDAADLTDTSAAAIGKMGTLTALGISDGYGFSARLLSEISHLHRLKSLSLIHVSQKKYWMNATDTSGSTYSSSSGNAVGGSDDDTIATAGSSGGVGNYRGMASFDEQLSKVLMSCKQLVKLTLVDTAPFTWNSVS